MPMRSPACTPCRSNSGLNDCVDGELLLADRRGRAFCAPIALVMNASIGWYSQVGTCFIAAARKTTPLAAGPDRVVADVADGGSAAAVALLVETLTSSDARRAGTPSASSAGAPLREDDDLLGHAKSPSSRAGAPGPGRASRCRPVTMPLTVEQGPASACSRRAEAASSATISGPAAGREEPGGPGVRLESRLRSITTELVGRDLDVKLEGVGEAAPAGRAWRWVGAQMPQAVQRLMALDDVGDRAGENRCRRSAEHSPRESSHRAAP